MNTDTGSVYQCGNANRRQAVRAATGPGGQPFLNGIDFLEVSESSQSHLQVSFLHPLPGEAGGVPPGQPALQPDNFRISGGQRITGIRVVSVAASGDRLELETDTPGDFSFYTLRLVAGPGSDSPPPGFDPRLASVRFSFKAGCPSPFDCRTALECTELPPGDPRIDYLARDYDSFRRVLLDRLRLLVPDYTETSPADFPIALAELLAYVGDQMAYAQESNATEAFLGTARQRVSVRRHARLRDYWMHEGCNARTWIQVSVEPGGAADGWVLERGTAFFAGRPADLQSARQGNLDLLDPGSSGVFEAMESLQLRSANNRFRFYTWSDTECLLCKGARQATLFRPPGASLQPGMVLVVEEIRDPAAPANSRAAGRPDRRWPVRLTAVKETVDVLTGEELLSVYWAEEDALPFSFFLSRRVDDLLVEDLTVVHGNVVLADHGWTQRDTPVLPVLDPPQAPLDGSPYRPVLERYPLTCSSGMNDPSAIPAALCTIQDPAASSPEVWLESGGQTWHAVKDLLGSDGSAAEFVVETGNEGQSFLRFGDGQHGRTPAPGEAFRVRYRIGNGSTGNIGAEAVSALLEPVEGILNVRNPLAASSGADPESIEQVKQFAPVAFRTQNRAVTLEDYAEVAQRFPGVQQARARFRWLASWYTVTLAVDRTGGLPVDEAFRADLLAHMEQYRMTGYDLEIRDPVYIPLDMELEVCLKQGADATAVQRELLERLGPGPGGLFHPENLTFGQRIYGSRILSEAMRVGGVDHARLVRMKRFWEPQGTELDDGFLEFSGLELPQLANDPSLPERGRIIFTLKGGL